MGNVRAIALLGVGGALALVPAWPGTPHESSGVELASSSAPKEPRPVEPDGLLVLGVLSPERAMVADPRSGAASERRLAGGTLCRGPILGIGRRVILTGSRRRRPVALWLPLMLTGPARSLGAADTVTPSSTPGRLWLGRWKRLHAGAARVALREVDVDGRTVVRMIQTLPRWSMLQAVVDNALLVTHGRGLTLWQREGRQRTIRDGWLIAAHGSRFAWCPGDCRRLNVWSRDRELTVHPPERLRPDLGGRAAFSPDGSRLAMPLRTARGARVGVVELSNGRWSLILGARIVGYRSIAWSPSGRWLYFTGRGHRLYAWHEGTRQPMRLPIRPRGTVMSIATVNTPS